MAEIPVKEKSNSWIWWLLLLLGIAALLWFLLANNDDDDVVDYNDTDTAAVVADDTAAMTGTAVTAMAVGESVDLNNVRVTELNGDMAFTVDNAGQNMLVLFDETRTPNSATEGEYDINVGSMINIDGEVRSATDPLPDGITATIPAGTQQYIYATALEMVS